MCCLGARKSPAWPDSAAQRVHWASPNVHPFVVTEIVLVQMENFTEFDHGLVRAVNIVLSLLQWLWAVL